MEAKEIVAKLKEKYRNGKSFVVHDCSLCGYPCGYTWSTKANAWLYDLGCDCTNFSGGQEVHDDEDVEDFVERNKEFVEKSFLSDAKEATLPEDDDAGRIDVSDFPIPSNCPMFMTATDHLGKQRKIFSIFQHDVDCKSWSHDSDFPWFLDNLYLYEEKLNVVASVAVEFIQRTIDEREDAIMKSVGSAPFNTKIMTSEALEIFAKLGADKRKWIDAMRGAKDGQ